MRGDYEEASNWCTWGIRTFEENSLADSPRLLRLINNWAYVRILRGDLAGLGTLLAENTQILDSSYPNLARLFRATLGDYLLVTKELDEALTYYQKNLQQCSRSNLGFAALDMVRGLQEMDNFSEALPVAKRAYDLTKIDPDYLRAPAVLAYGIALLETNPQDALPYLLKAKEYFSDPLSSYRLTQAVLYLARAYMLTDKLELAKEILFQSKQLFTDLATPGLHLLAGPKEKFKEIFGLISGESAALEIRLSGELEVWLEQKRVNISPQQLELLAIMALKTRPLNIEELLAYLYGDGGNKVSLKATISKLRQKVPVSPSPYKITVPYKVDIQEIEQALHIGQLEKATTLYRGSILPLAKSPFLREYTESLTESLRQAAINQQNIEALYRLGEYEQFSEDMELLEVTLGALKKNDPRAAVLQTRVNRLQVAWNNLN